MSLLRRLLRLLGRSQRSATPSQDAANRAQEAWAALSWDASRRLLESNSELVDALRWVLTLPRRECGAEWLRDSCSEHLVLLERAERIGLQSAFAEKIAAVGPLKVRHCEVHPGRLTAAVNAVLRDPIDRGVLDDFPELVTVDSDRALAQVAREFVSQPENESESEVSIGELTRVREVLAHSATAGWMEQAAISARNGAIADAARAYSNACDAADRALWLSSTGRSRFQVLMRTVALFPAAAHALVRHRDLTSAVTLLERGRTRLARTRAEWRAFSEQARGCVSDEVVAHAVSSARQFIEFEALESGVPKTTPDAHGVRALASRFAKLSDDELASYSAASVSLTRRLQTDPRLQIQFQQVLPLKVQGEDHESSPFFDREAFAELEKSYRDLVDLLPPADADRPQPPYDQRRAQAFDRMHCAFAATGEVHTPLSWHRVRDWVSSESDAPPIVQLVTEQQSTWALVTIPGQPEPHVVSLEISDLGAADLHRFLEDGTDGSPSWFEAYKQRQFLLSPWLETIERGIELSWQLMEPVCRALDAAGHNRAVLIPFGQLRCLPLEASTLVHGSRLVWTSALSIQSWRAASERARAFSKPLDLLAVLAPTPSKLPQLPDARDEVTVLSARFYRRWGKSWWCPRVLEGEYASPDVVCGVGGFHTIAHYACHAFADWVPERSGLVLAGDRPLRASALRDVGVGAARLCVLAACETGLVRSPVADEAATLPAAFLAAGYAGVVSTLWAVPGLSTGVLMIRFYEEWLDQGREPAAALRAAQDWLRQTTNEEKRRYFSQESAPAIPECPQDVRDAVTAARARFAAEFVSDPQFRRFEHPYYWAGFHMTGA